MVVGHLSLVQESFVICPWSFVVRQKPGFCDNKRLDTEDLVKKPGFSSQGQMTSGFADK